MKPELEEFIGTQAPTTDIFCFQEVGGSDLPFYLELLPDYKGVFANKSSLKNFCYGLAVFVRRDIEITDWKAFLMKNAWAGIALWTKLKSPEGNEFAVCNVHGNPFPGHKLDTPGRLVQSGKIIHRMERLKTPAKIIGGDFNLLPQAQSVGMFEGAGFRDLIGDYGIPTTRNQKAWARHPDNPQYYADYVFVRGMEVIGFCVPEIIVSDHQPMIVNFEI